MPALSATTRGYLHGLAAVALFGLTLPFTRLAVAELPPVFVGLGRSIVAVAIAGPMLWLAGTPVPSGREMMRLAAMAAGVVLGFPLLSAIAMQTAPASHGGVVLGILPLATAAMSVVFAGERPSYGFWLCGIAGGAAVVTFALLDGGVNLYLADGLLVLAVICAAAGYAIGGDLSRTREHVLEKCAHFSDKNLLQLLLNAFSIRRSVDTSPEKALGGWQVISWALLLAFPVLLPPVLWSLQEVNWQASATAWLSFLYVAVFSQFLGFFLWNKGMALAGVAKVGQTQLLQVFVTLAGSALLLGEPIKSVTALFAVLVVAAVALGRSMAVART